MGDTLYDTDLIIIGGGPAGCAAARMAASVGMRSILVEPDRLCRNLYRIPALNNVLGGYTSGPELADAIVAELKTTELCGLELGRYVTEIHADDDQVTATLDTGASLTAPYAIVATGVGPLQPSDATWITAPAGLTLPAFWQADADGYRFSRREGSRWVTVERDDLLRPQKWQATGIAVQPANPIELSPEWIGIAWELGLSLEGRQLRLRDDGSGQLQVVE